MLGIRKVAVKSMEKMKSLQEEEEEGMGSSPMM
jgi:hypothetical protein